MKKNSYILMYFKRYLFFIGLSIIFIILLSIKLVGINNVHEFNNKGSNNIFNKNLGQEPKIKVYITKQNKVKQMGLEEYIKGVVSAEMPAEFNIEALKAQAIAARTYAMAHMKLFNGTCCKKAQLKDADICDTVHCQVFINKSDRIKSWPKKYSDKYWNKIVKAVNDTEGEFLTYNNRLVKNPYYFATSSGKTENAAEVFSLDKPYLVSVDSPGEERAPKYKTKTSFTYDDFIKKIKNEYPKVIINKARLKHEINIQDRSEGGSVKKIKVGNTVLTGPQFRKVLSLNSSNFSIKFNLKTIDIICNGYGHGVGMSQWGANSMGKSGEKYSFILKHYYKGIKIDKLNYK